MGCGTAGSRVKSPCGSFFDTFFLQPCKNPGKLLAFAFRGTYIVKMLSSQTGAIFRKEPAGYVRIFVFMLLGYLPVLLLDFRRIQQLPPGRALKDAA